MSGDGWEIGRSGERRFRDAATYDDIAGAYADRWFGLRLPEAMVRLTGRLARGERVLDAGCGPGRDVAWLSALGFDAIGVDLSAGMLREGLTRGVTAPLIQADMGHLPFKDSSFQGVWACASLLHIARTDALYVLQEFERVVHPGYLYAMVKEGEDQAWVQGAWGERRFYVYWRPGEIQALIRQAGFEVLGCWVGDDRAGRPHPWIGVLGRSEAPA